MKRNLTASVLATACLLHSALCAASPTEALPSFRLWVNEKARPVKTYEDRVAEHPCGSVVELQTSRLPEYRWNAYLQPERVFEVGEQGKTLRTWVMPVDSVVVAIEGEKLYFQLYEHTFVVDQRRRVKRAELTDEPQRPTEAKCAAPASIKPSDYAACLNFRDLKSGKVRALVYELVCT